MPGLLRAQGMRFSCELLGEQPSTFTERTLTNLYLPRSSFRIVSLRQTAQTSEDETLRFVKRNEWVRDEGRND
jgi:hypothetical protein